MLYISYIVLFIAALLLLYLLMKGVCRLYDLIGYYCFPTQHELERRLENLLIKVAEMRKKRKLKEHILTTSKIVKKLEKEEAKIDSELKKVDKRFDW